MLVGMFPFPPPPALIEEAPALPPSFSLPDGLRVKPGSLSAVVYDQEFFELRSQAGIDRHPVAGATWRFQVEAQDGSASVSALLERLKPALEAAGWSWQWVERGVASRSFEGRVHWLKLQVAGGGVLKVVVVIPGGPRAMTIAKPGPVAVLPRGDADFPYLPPWPGGKLARTAVTKSTAVTEVQPGQPKLLLVDFIEKEYTLPEPPSPQEFISVYSKALESAGWELEGTFKSGLTQIQASYYQEGRDLRLVLRLVENAMAISVADIGLQRPTGGSKR